MQRTPVSASPSFASDSTAYVLEGNAVLALEWYSTAQFAPIQVDSRVASSVPADGHWQRDGYWYRDGDWQIFLADAEGGEPRRFA